MRRLPISGLATRLVAGALAGALGLSMSNAGAADTSALRAEMVTSDAASVLARFYPAPLAWQVPGSVDDQQTWMAKVRGMLQGAPAMLRQSILASQNAEDFSSNMVMLEQLQESRARQSGGERGVAMGGFSPSLHKQLGASDQLVYTALSPCRILDTRNASAGSGVLGPLAGNTLFTIPGFVTAGLNWSTYGQIAPLSDCGLNSTVGSDIKAVALVITILNPNFSAFLGVSDVNSLSTVLSKVALNYTAGQGLSTLYIVPQTTANSIRFAMPAGLSAHLIFDVVGYFARSEATPLDCVRANSGDVAVAVNTGTVVSATCPAGYTATGGGFDFNEGSLGVPGMWLWGNLPVSSSTWWVYISNQTSGARNVKSTVVCCRVPGR